MEKKQAFNPYLPSWEYIPDGEPYVYGDRLYVFGSHDEFNGKNFCQNDYVCWSAPIDNLADWKYEGVIYRKDQDPALNKINFMQAPDMANGKDGRYYLYYTLALKPHTSVAVSDSITGPYEYYGELRTKDGRIHGAGKNEVFHFDPGVFVDDDGRIYMYTGFAPKKKGIMRLAMIGHEMRGGYVMELEDDMKTMKNEPKLILPGVEEVDKHGFEGHEFFEASSMRKINGKYYLIYSSVQGHELCYAVSGYPDRGFEFGGTLVSNGDIGYEGRTHENALNYTGNTHGSLVCVKGQWYVFYHRQTNRHQYSRQACAEKIVLNEDGSFTQAEMTSCGLNDGPLAGKGIYEARIACNLMSKDGACFYTLKQSKKTVHHPYFTQTGVDREGNGDQYIANMRDGAVAGFKYFDFEELVKISVCVDGEAKGKMQVLTKLDGEPICEIFIRTREKKAWFTASAKNITGERALYFRYVGNGSLDFHYFKLV